MDEKQKRVIVVARPQPYILRLQSRTKRCLTAAVLILCTCFILVSVPSTILNQSLNFTQISKYNSKWTPPVFHSSPPSTIEEFQQCSITNLLSTGLPFLDPSSPLSVSEFVTRRQRLATALLADGIDAYIVEPGYTFQYYANISQKDWEVWEPEERPFLMIVQPDISKDGSVRARTRFLTPSFEVERARLLGMPWDGNVEGEMEFVGWEEHWNPYSTLLDSWKFYPSSSSSSSPFPHPQTLRGEKKARKPKIMVDEEMRDFIQRGLGENGFEVVGLGGEVERVKQTKSQAEIEIVRAVNTGTVEAVRAMRKCLVPGLTENEVAEVLDNTLRAAGMEPFFDIVLFDENASNPHGGTNGSKVLEAETFVLIDVGTHLYGYSSDICRTFFPPFFPKPTSPAEIRALSPITQQKLSVWDTVLEAQTQSMHALLEGNSAASVDIAARKVITDAGYGDAFAHRVGHGIGIKAHESPYLNKGNVNVTLKAGMTFTSEPGIYLVDKFGVRHEDILLVKESGEPEILTGTRAVGPWDP